MLSCFYVDYFEAVRTKCPLHLIEAREIHPVARETQAFMLGRDSAAA